MCRERPRERVNTALGHRVIEQSLVPEKTSDRACIDDYGSPPHLRNRRLGHINVSVEIRLERLVEVWRSQVFELRRMDLKRRVVHEDVELAEFSDRSRDGAPAKFLF